MGYRKIGVIGGRGFGEDQFRESLRGIGVDTAGLLYAVGDNEVKVFDGKGTLRRRWRTSKPGHCVAVDGNERVYVGEEDQIERFDLTGQRAETWPGEGRLGRITAIGFFDRFLLSGDAVQRCIHRHDKDGKFLNDIGKNNRMKGFLIPNGHLDFDIDAEGTVHAANPGKHRVERYSPAGELLGHFGKFGTRDPADFGGCCNPTNVALRPNGEVVVTEKAVARMKVYNDQGTLISVVGTEAFDQNCKNMDLATDSRGRIYVVDTVALGIQVFAPDESAKTDQESTKTEETDGGAAS